MDGWMDGWMEGRKEGVTICIFATVCDNKEMMTVACLFLYKLKETCETPCFLQTPGQTRQSSKGHQIKQISAAISRIA